MKFVDLSLLKAASSIDVTATLVNRATEGAGQGANASDSGSSTVVIATTITYTLTVTNSGDADATNVTLVDNPTGWDDDSRQS